MDHDIANKKTDLSMDQWIKISDRREVYLGAYAIAVFGGAHLLPMVLGICGGGDPINPPLNQCDKWVTTVLPSQSTHRLVIHKGRMNNWVGCMSTARIQINAHRIIVWATKHCTEEVYC